jgi:hypothetical protein
MAVDFPSNPSDGDEFVSGIRTYIYDATKSKWNVKVPGSTYAFNSLGAVSDHIIPSADITYDLGSANYRFRDLYLSGNSIQLGNRTISEDNIPEVDLTIVPETLQIAVDSPTAGHSGDWLWTWKSGALPYARTTITNQVQANVPLYESGVYTLFNFAAHEIHGTMTQTHKIHLKWIEGAGTDNNISWATSTLNVQGITVAGVNDSQPTEVQRININVPETITAPTLVAPNVTYDVSFTQAGAYTFTGTANGQNPTLGPLYRGGTYTFALDSSVSGHPFYLTTDNGASWAQGAYAFEYTDGVTGSRNDSGTVVFTVPANAPNTLYYQCGNHSNMRGELVIKDLEVEVNGSGNFVVYFQHDQEEHAVPVELRPKPGLVQQICLVYDGASGKFIPQDMGDYITKTAVIQERIQELAATTVDTKLSDGVVTDIATVKENTTFVTNLNQQGELQVHTGTARWYAPFDLEVTGISAKVSTPADQIIAIEVKRDSLLAKSANILAGQYSTSVGSPNFTMNEGQYLTVDLTQVGLNAKGEDLVVQFKYRQTS